MGGGSVTANTASAASPSTSAAPRTWCAPPGRRREAVRLHRVQQRGDGRPANRRRRRNPALHRTFQRSVHRDQGRRREVRASRTTAVDGHADLLDPAQWHLGPRRSDHVPQGVRERARRARQGPGRQQARQTRQLLRAQPDSRFHPGRRAPGARRNRTRPGVLHQRRRADQHVRVLPTGRRGVRAAIPEVPRVGTARPRRDVGMAVAALPVRPAQAAAGTACGRTHLPGQLLLGRQGASAIWATGRCSPPSRRWPNVCRTTPTSTPR